jgi:hypothetical protein
MQLLKRGRAYIEEQISLKVSSNCKFHLELYNELSNHLFFESQSIIHILRRYQEQYKAKLCKLDLDDPMLIKSL